jgi:hypothetical protein
MKEEIVYCGIDLAKEQLDVALEQKHWQVGNQKAPINRLVKQLRSRAGIHVICEASGGYEQLLVCALEQANVAFTLVQPNRVRQFARATGILAKTDRIDASVLVSFAQPSNPLRPRHCRSRCGSYANWIGSAATCVTCSRPSKTVSSNSAIESCVRCKEHSSDN